MPWPLLPCADVSIGPVRSHDVSSLRIPQLHDARRKALRLEQAEGNLRKAAREQRAAGAEEERNDVDGPFVDEALAKKAAHQGAAVEIDAPYAFAVEPFGELAGRSRPHLLAMRRGQRASRADDYALLSIGPFREGEHRVVGAAPDHQRVDAGEEGRVAVLLVVERSEPVDAAVGPGDVAIEAHGAEDGEPDLHRGLLPRLTADPTRPGGNIRLAQRARDERLRTFALDGGEDLTDRLPRGKLPIWQQSRHYLPNQNQHVGTLF